MTIEQIIVADLRPYENNAKRHSPEQVQALAESIKTFGFTSPVLIDEDNGILAGHGRVAAAKHIGMESVPCIRLTGLSDTQKRAYILADNRLSEIGGGWDTDLLRAELRKIEEEMPELAEAAGWSENELTALLRSDEAAIVELRNPTHSVNAVEQGNENRLNAVIRQIILVYGLTEYERVVNAMSDYAEKNGLSNNTEVINHLLETNGYAISDRQV